MYSVHKSMTKDDSDNNIRGSYNQFIALFNSVKWYKQKDFNGSLFGVDSDSKFHAEIIKINGVGFVCNNFFTYRKVSKFVKNFIANSDAIYPYKYDVVDKLNKLLEEECEKINISVEYVKEIQSENLREGNVILGQIHFHSNRNEFFFDESKILVREDVKYNPSTLAHEIGHYIGISTDKDRSEKRANVEGYNLCKRLLGDLEFEMVENMLKGILY